MEDEDEADPRDVAHLLIDEIFGTHEGELDACERDATRAFRVGPAGGPIGQFNFDNWSIYCDDCAPNGHCACGCPGCLDRPSTPPRSGTARHSYRTPEPGLTYHLSARV